MGVTSSAEQPTTTTPTRPDLKVFPHASIYICSLCKFHGTGDYHGPNEPNMCYTCYGFVSNSKYYRIGDVVWFVGTYNANPSILTTLINRRIKIKNNARNSAMRRYKRGELIKRPKGKYIRPLDIRGIEALLKEEQVAGN